MEFIKAQDESTAASLDMDFEDNRFSIKGIKVEDSDTDLIK